MIIKKQIKNKLQIRNKLIKYNYELDSNDSVKNGMEIFNDQRFDEIWIRKANFIITKCDFDWKVITKSNNSQIYCECMVFNLNSTSYYNAAIFINQKMSERDISFITNQIQNRIINKIEDNEIDEWKKGNNWFTLNSSSLEGKVTCILFDLEYHLNITIPIPDPEELVQDEIKALIDEHREDNHWSNDWKRANFDALTDGQNGDYDDFDGDWDRLNDWRGA